MNEPHNTILAIESSCDETAAAVVLNGKKILSNIVYSQHDIHRKHGGIVPELAGRSHMERIHKVVQKALSDANLKLHEIDLIAVTQGPGLIGSLLVGLNFAKGLSFVSKKPLCPVNHIEGHLLAFFLQDDVSFPFMGLIASGGHTELIRVDGIGQYRYIGRTRDDAAGESFDKVAKMMNLDYPGGPLIDRMSKTGRSDAYPFPRAMLKKENPDFSFSGLKTAVKNVIHKRENNSLELSDNDIAASFQEAVVDQLVLKSVWACQEQDINKLVVSGGVAANSRLRERLNEIQEIEKIDILLPEKKFCTDNAAMIASAAYQRSKNLNQSVSIFSLDADANFSLA